MSKNTDAKYWINFRAVRQGDDHYAIDSKDGVVKFCKTHSEALEFCEKSGETFYDNT